MSAVPAVERPAFTSPQRRSSRVRRAEDRGWWAGGTAGSENAGNVVSIDEARSRLRGTALDDAVARHPAGTGFLRRDLGTGRTVVSRAAGAARTESAPALDLRLAAARALTWVAAAIVVLTAALGIGVLLRPAPYSGPTWAHSVVAGESVWSVAASLGSPRALEDVVTDILELNGLADGIIHPGQELLLPTE